VKLVLGNASKIDRRNEDAFCHRSLHTICDIIAGRSGTF